MRLPTGQAGNTSGETDEDSRTVGCYYLFACLRCPITRVVRSKKLTGPYVGSDGEGGVTAGAVRPW